MKVALLDLGSNTFHLLIVDMAIGGGYVKVFKKKIPVKLLKGSGHDNRIQPEAFFRGLKALQSFATLMQEHKVMKVNAFATSAVRTAANGAAFIEEVKALTGIEITLITGDQEAEYVYYGVRPSIPVQEQPVLILDIGGGSNEFILANREEIFWKKSFNLGAARLLEKFHPPDPMDDATIDSLHAYFNTELASLFEAVALHQPTMLIGSSGSFDTFAELINVRFVDTMSGKGLNNEFDLMRFYEVHRVLLASTTLERASMKGLVEMRVDMIVMASLFTAFVLEKTGLHRMSLASGALKEGMLDQLSRSLPLA